MYFRFGWFGMDKDKISHVGLNYGGVVLAAFSILLLVLVKDEISSAKPEDEGDETQVAPLSQQSSVRIGAYWSDLAHWCQLV